MNRGIVYSISIASDRGTLKKEVPEAKFIEGFGIDGDGHAGDWGRQVTCLDFASVLKSNEKNNLNMSSGDFAENVLLEGIDFSKIEVGARIKLGDTVVIEVTQIGKEDHPSIVTETFGVSLLPYEGLFCKVLVGGTVKKGDSAHAVF